MTHSWDLSCGDHRDTHGEFFQGACPGVLLLFSPGLCLLQESSLITPAELSPSWELQVSFN